MFEDLGLLDVRGRTGPDVAQGAVERGRVAAFGTAPGRSKTWTVGERIKGVFLDSGADGDRVRVAGPHSQVPVVNGLMPGDTIQPGDDLAVLVDASFGIADPDAGLPVAAGAVKGADENSDSLFVVLDGTMSAEAGVQTRTQYVSGDTNGGNLTTTEGPVWTSYPTAIPRLASPAELVVVSTDAADTTQTVRVRGVRGATATIPYDEFEVDVALNGTTEVNLTTADSSLTGAEAPLDVNGLSVFAAAGSPALGTVNVATVGGATILHEVALRGGNSRGSSQIATYTIPGGWRGRGVLNVAAGAFGDANYFFDVQPPGLEPAESAIFHLNAFAQAIFIPPFSPGSATLQTGFHDAGTRFTAFAFTSAGSAEGGIVFSIELEVIP